MGKPVNSNVERAETTALNIKVNKEVLESFKDCLGKYGYPMNVMLETFMIQYANGKFNLSDEDVLKFKNDGKDVDALSTTFNKEIYLNFKDACKAKKFFVKHVVTAFMEKYVDGHYVLEYKKVANKI